MQCGYLDAVDRYSRTGRVLRNPAAAEPAYAVPPGSLPHDPSYVLRLAWKVGPRVPTDWSALTEAVRQEEELVVFCDNSAFDDDAPADLWEALLSVPGRLMLTRRVSAELRPWLLKRPLHPVHVAIRDDHDAVGFRDEPAVGQPGRRVFDYYMALLASRRNFIEVMRRVFRREQGRDPDPAEELQLANDLQRNFGERGRLIGTKPIGRATDEALVYLAVEHAITTGKQTLVLTRDADVEDQFFKLLWLVDTHYRGMLLATRYAADPSAFPTRPVPDAILQDLNGPFEPRDALLIERDAYMRGLLPARRRFVAISCWNAGAYFSSLTFGAEMEMRQLLEIKDKTGGWSTDCLDGRNMHASVSPLPVGGKQDFAALVYDRRKNVARSGASIAKLDFMQALVSGERHAAFVETMVTSPPEQRPS
jgi:hypothetical protein